MNKWHNIIRKRLKENRKECLSCLYPPSCYEWGIHSKYKKNTLALVNKIVRGVPVEAWPGNKNDMCRKIASGRWAIDLEWVDKRRTANLRHKNNDHTAWCIEHSKKHGIFVDLDIGGS